MFTCLLHVSDADDVRPVLESFGKKRVRNSQNDRRPTVQHNTQTQDTVNRDPVRVSHIRAQTLPVWAPEISSSEWTSSSHLSYDHLIELHAAFVGQKNKNSKYYKPVYTQTHTGNTHNTYYTTVLIVVLYNKYTKFNII